MNTASDRIIHSMFEACADASDEERRRLEDEIVRRHLGLARRLAHRYVDRGADIDDLIQVANFALVKAMRGFDPAKGNFVPFATATILGEIKRHFRDHCWSVRAPRPIQELQADLTQATADHWQQHAASPSAADLSMALGVDIADVREAQAASGCFQAASLDVPSRSDGQTVGDRLADHARDEFERVNNAVTISDAIRGLDEAQRELVGLRFYDRLTQQEIAERTGVSQMQVSRRLARLLDELRTALGPVAA